MLILMLGFFPFHWFQTSTILKQLEENGFMPTHPWMLTPFRLVIVSILITLRKKLPYSQFWGREGNVVRSLYSLWVLHLYVIHWIGTLQYFVLLLYFTTISCACRAHVRLFLDVGVLFWFTKDNYLFLYGYCTMLLCLPFSQYFG